MQAEQPQLYESLTKNLTPDEQQVLTAAVHQADVVAAVLAADANHANGEAHTQA